MKFLGRNLLWFDWFFLWKLIYPICLSATSLLNSRSWIEPHIFWKVNFFGIFLDYNPTFLLICPLFKRYFELNPTKKNPFWKIESHGSIQTDTIFRYILFCLDFFKFVGPLCTAYVITCLQSCPPMKSWPGQGSTLKPLNLTPFINFQHESITWENVLYDLLFSLV